jgi:hypothetical protein
MGTYRTGDSAVNSNFAGGGMVNEAAFMSTMAHLIRSAR